MTNSSFHDNDLGESINYIGLICKKCSTLRTIECTNCCGTDINPIPILELMCLEEWNQDST